MDPFSTSAIFAGINSAIKFAEIAVRITEVGTENEVFVRTITVVRNDLNETQRLLSEPSVQKKLLKTPTKIEWIKGCISSTQRALYEIGKWVERARVDQAATGSVKFETRVKWVFNNHEKLLNRQTELSACHQQLSGILLYLTPLEDPDDSGDPPSSDQVTFFEDMLSPRQRRRKTYQQAQASQPYRLENANPNDPPAATDAQFTRRSQSYPTTATLSTVPAPPQATKLLAASEPTILHGPIDADCVSVPSSPPPSYVAATQNTCSIRPVSSGSGSSFDIPRKAISSPSTPSLNQTTSEKTTTEVYGYNLGQTTFEKNNMEIHAHYADAPINNYPVSDFMGATNYSGPVDPFAMFHELEDTTVQKTQPIAEANISQTPEIVEAPGDSSFPVELPTNDPGPPPGYPRLRPRTKVSSSRRFKPSAPYLPTQPLGSFNMGDMVHELPTTYPQSQSSQDAEPQESPLRRRTLSDTSHPRESDVFPEVCETADHPHRFWGPPPSSSRLPSGSSYRSSTSSIPTTTSFQGSTSSIPTVSSFRSSTSTIPTMSSFSSSTTSVATLSSVFLSPPPQEIERSVSPLQDTTNSGSQPPSQSQVTKKPETAKSKRMRNQKEYMNMVSNLELT